MSSGGPELPHEPFKIEKYTQDEVPQLEVAIFRLGGPADHLSTTY